MKSVSTDNGVIAVAGLIHEISKIKKSWPLLFLFLSVCDLVPDLESTLVSFQPWRLRVCDVSGMAS